MKRSESHNVVDVGVVGGGPAGAAVALALRRLGYSTAVIERSDYRDVRIGETLPPAVKPLLSRLGVWDQFVSQEHSPAFGIRSAWGGDRPYEHDFIFNAYGSGWHVERARFDSMLVQCAEHAGVTVYRQSLLTACKTSHDGNWEIEITRRDTPLRLLTKFLIDATGRASAFACGRGCKRIIVDSLIGIIGFFNPGSVRVAPDSFTLIEAVETGWWYSASLPDARLVVAFMTDADIYAGARRHSRDYWQQQFHATQHTRSRVKHNSEIPNLIVVPANSSRLEHDGKGKWLAIGDAAMAFDPLAGQGVYQALHSASRAAEAIDQHLHGDNRALPDYSVATEQDFERYLLARRMFYCREQRWPNSTFWKRRVSDQVSAKQVLSTANA